MIVGEEAEHPQAIPIPRLRGRQAINQLTITARRALILEEGQPQHLPMAKNDISHLEVLQLEVTVRFPMKEVKVSCLINLEGGVNIYSSCDNR